MFDIIGRIKQKFRTARWRRDNCEKTLRLDYDLNNNSVVFDLGGYEGEWSSDIFSRYACNIHIFEPVREFSDVIRDRFKEIGNIIVYNFGLSSEDRTEQISVDNNSSSIFKTTGDKVENIALKNAVNFLKDNYIVKIDLMKINIEGGEYDLLDALVSDPAIGNIHNIQVQFHDFVPNAHDRMKKIQKKLAVTHELTYQYKFVWENWKRKG
ncbi:MAG: FkbM family methyltransferase [Candidatus Magasanikbacteria bacterium]|nr:FkbM family methyltransferase [Candidatus Magasanikbacteria bacterium]